MAETKYRGLSQWPSPGFDCGLDQGLVVDFSFGSFRLTVVPSISLDLVAAPDTF